MGHTFYLADKYSSLFGAKYMPPNDPSALLPIHMGCYGLGLSRMIAAIAQVSHDDVGLIWPEQVAPWKYIVLQGKDGGGELVYDDIATVIGLDNVLLDDRPDISIGRKLREAKRIGYPYIVVLGKEWAENGMCEVIRRQSGETRHIERSALLDLKSWKAS
jgi:prolyl-tRNA synthetase